MRSIPIFAVALVLMAAFVALPHQAYAQGSATLYVVSGVVVDDDGSPVDGANVIAYIEGDPTQKRLPAPDGSSYATAAQDGSFTLKLPPGNATITAHARDTSRSGSASLTIAGDVDGVRIVIPPPPPRTAALEGRVLDAAGQPVEGATVRLDQGCCYIMSDATPPPETVPAEEGSSSGSGATSSSPSSSPSVMPIRCCDDQGQSVTTGADGSYVFKTYAGPRQLTASAPGFAQVSAQVTAEENKTVTTDLMLLKVPKADAKLTGRVLDAKTGAPIANAQVSVRSLEWGRYAWNETGPDGRYSMDLLPGWTAIDVYVNAYGIEPMPLAGDKASSMPAPGAATYYGHSEVIKLASGENPHDIELDAKPKPSIALVGYVVDPDAKEGVAGAQVSFWNQDTGDWGSATTDDTGSFRILARPGHHTASAWKEGHLGGQITFTVDEAATQRVDVPLPKGEARYAPCEGDDACGGPILYAERGAVAPSSGSAKTSEVAQDAALDESSTTPAPGAPTTGPMTYEGSGGGLPKYDAASAGDIPGAKPVPMPGIVALVVALAAVAIIRVMKK